MKGFLCVRRPHYWFLQWCKESTFSQWCNNGFNQRLQYFFLAWFQKPEWDGSRAEVVALTLPRTLSASLFRIDLDNKKTSRSSNVSGTTFTLKLASKVQRKRVILLAKQPWNSVMELNWRRLDLCAVKSQTTLNINVYLNNKEALLLLSVHVLQHFFLQGAVEHKLRSWVPKTTR